MPVNINYLMNAQNNIQMGLCMVSILDTYNYKYVYRFNLLKKKKTSQTCEKKKSGKYCHPKLIMASIDNDLIMF